MPLEARTASCHPSRPHAARGMCALCYGKSRRPHINAWRKTHRATHPEVRAIELEGLRSARSRRYRRTMVDLRALKLLRGCADCGYDVNSDALQFDHLPGFEKKAAPNHLAGAGIQQLVDELAKCEVVCANCHAIRTATRRKEATVAVSPAA